MATTRRRAANLAAVKRHRFADPLRDPGEADLTAHVDFCASPRRAAAGAAVHGPVPKANACPSRINERAAALRRHAASAKVRPSTLPSCAWRQWRGSNRR